MSRKKYDGVIEAVHYSPNGQVDWVRAYERRGSTFSDWLIIPRSQLVERLKAGKTFIIGRRVPYLASTFETGKPLHLADHGDTPLLTTDNLPVEKDTLAGAPII